jgi:hypothetical protein
MEKSCVLFREPNYTDLKSTLKLFQYILPVFRFARMSCNISLYIVATSAEPTN